MLGKPPTFDSLGPQDDSRSYKLWEEMHSRIIKEPPREGREYIKHLLNIFPFIEPISGMHPIASAIVKGFKKVLELEQIREENEMRVVAVFLAGTDTMRVFLDIDEVVTSDGHHPTLHPLNHDFRFATVLSRIQVTIDKCGINIHTYYKQSRLVKFYKAQEWEARMTGYIDDFKNHRVQLQGVLSYYNALNVKFLVTKMSDLVSRLFETKPDWEKTLATKIQYLGDRSKWLESDASLQAVVSAAEDPALVGIVTKKVESKSHEMGHVPPVNLSELRGKLELSLDESCNNNMNDFQSKLAFHTQQLRDAIASSARFVVRTLSGPYDRLQHEDLRELWKEMSWTFCVDNKLFSSALFEYYLDLFSNTLDPDSEANKKRLNSSRTDAWALDYIADHSQKLTMAIDQDNSGYIRIGWSYECRIYRKRMHRLMFKLMEMQAQVLRNNRSYLLSIIQQCHPICAPLAWEPRGQQLPPTTIELRSLVKDKVLAQDATLRAQLETLQWNIEDESVLRLVFPDVPLEKYVLQLSTLVLEQSLILADISCKLTLEVKEWDRLLYCQLTIRGVVLARVRTLSKKFAKDKDAMEDPKTHFGGIWSSVDLEKYRTYREDYPMDYTPTDIADYHHDLFLLDDFPLQSVEGEPRKHLKYKPWEEYIKSMDEADVPLAIPDEWDPAVIQEGGSALRAYWGRFPFTADRICDVCRGFPIVEHYYGCLTCEARFDVCASCYTNEPPSAIEIKHHKMEHPVVKWTLTPRIGQRQWTDFEANAVLDELRIDVLKSKNQIRDRAGSDSDEDGDHGDYGDEEMGEEEEEEQGEGGNEDEGGVIAAIAAIAAELGLDVDETDNEAGGVPPFPDHETMENLNQDAGETKTSNQAKYKDDGEEEEEEEERGDEEEGGVIAAGAGVATKLGFDVDESKVREVSPFPDDETMENQNQNAEETETGNQAKDKDNSVDGGEGVVQVVQDPVAPQRSYTCGRCSEGIDLDSTFYRCVGHSCRDFFICKRCESITSDSDAKNDDHKWWHSLLVLRKSLIKPVLKTASTKVEPTDSSTDGDDAHSSTNPHSALISAVEDTLHVALTAMESKVDSTRVALEGQLSSTTMNLEERVVKLDEKITELTRMNFEERVVKLDEKITELTRMNLEERVVKMDEKITELTKMLGDLIGRLNT